MKQTSHTIRRANVDDVLGIKQCVQAAFKPYISRMDSLPAPMLEDYVEVIKQHPVFIAETDKLVGMLVLIPKGDSVLLDTVAVHPDYQGNGLGRELLQLAETESLAMHANRIDLYTNECMTENLHLYQRFGYQEKERKFEKGYRRVYMQKCLP